MAFWLFFMAACFMRNTPDSALRQFFEPFNRAVLTPLGFFHRGWSMFPSVTEGASIRRLTYTFLDGSQVFEDYFPLRSSWVPSVWNEVMEDLLVRDDNGDHSRRIQHGFFQYQCRHMRGKTSLSGKLVSMKIEAGFVPLYDLFTNYGDPIVPPQYGVTQVFECER